MVIPANAGPPGQRHYVRLDQPVTLPPNTIYYLVSEEDKFGDGWHDYAATVLRTTNVATCDAAVYVGSGYPWSAVGGPNRCYGPVDFRYSTEPVPALTAIEIHSSPPAGGLVTGGGNYQSGDRATVNASAHPGFFFSHWSEVGTNVSNSPGYSFTAARDRILVAHFVNPWRTIRINEFLARTDPPQLDYVELHNYSDASVDVGGCALTDDPATNRFIIPAQTMIPPLGFVVFTELDLAEW